MMRNGEIVESIHTNLSNSRVQKQTSVRVVV